MSQSQSQTKETSDLLSKLRSQETALRTIEWALESGRIHHAYLFVGPNGVGKELAAFGLAGPAWAALLMGWTAGLVLLGAVVLLRVHRRLARAPLGARARNRAECGVVASAQ